MSGPFGPGGVSGTSASGAPYGYMAWESFKLKEGSNSTNSTNATYAGPAPLLVLHDSGANVRASPGYGLLAMALGAVLCGLVPTWGMLLVMVPAVMPQAAAEAYVGPYMAAESMREKVPNGMNATNAPFVGPPKPLLTLFVLAASTRRVLQGGQCALILMVSF
jgi:hypothetical protein